MAFADDAADLILDPYGMRKLAQDAGYELDDTAILDTELPDQGDFEKAEDEERRKKRRMWAILGSAAGLGALALGGYGVYKNRHAIGRALGFGSDPDQGGTGGPSLGLPSRFTDRIMPDSYLDEALIASAAGAHSASKSRSVSRLYSRLGLDDLARRSAGGRATPTASGFADTASAASIPKPGAEPDAVQRPGLGRRLMSALNPFDTQDTRDRDAHRRRTAFGEGISTETGTGPDAHTRTRLNVAETRRLGTALSEAINDPSSDNARILRGMMDGEADGARGRGSLGADATRLDRFEASLREARDTYTELSRRRSTGGTLSAADKGRLRVATQRLAAVDAAIGRTSQPGSRGTTATLDALRRYRDATAGGLARTRTGRALAGSGRAARSAAAAMALDYLIGGGFDAFDYVRGKSQGRADITTGSGRAEAEDIARQLAD